MSTIPKTIFGQISFKAIIAVVGPQCLGHGQCGSKCNITNGEGWGFIRDDLIHPLCICTTIEDGMGCKNWDLESSKTSRAKQLVDVLDFHESKWFMEGKKQ